MGTDLGTNHAPAATRAQTPGWRDPRLWIGVAIVAVCVVAGARLLGSADETVKVWAVTDDMAAGQPLTTDDLVVSRIRFAEPGDADRYFVGSDLPPADLVLRHGLGSGELLPRSAVGPAAENDLLSVPISVPVERVPPGVETGSIIDVFLVGSGDSDKPCDECADPVLHAVPVVDAPMDEGGFGGGSSSRQLVVAITEEQTAEFFSLLGRSDGADLTVVRRS